jgi:carboxylesterase type B
MLASVASILSIAACVLATHNTLVDAQNTGTTNNSALLMKTSLGNVLGSYYPNTNNTVIQYTNIPFADAASYTGMNRWKKAAPITTFNSTIDGTRPSETCIIWTGTATSGLESCLTVDFYVPADTSTRPANGYPVFMDLPSGGFTGESELDIGSLVARYPYFIGVIIKYRTNIFGFLSTTALSAENNGTVQSSGKLNKLIVN